MFKLFILLVASQSSHLHTCTQHYHLTPPTYTHVSSHPFHLHMCTHMTHVSSHYTHVSSHPTYLHTCKHMYRHTPPTCTHVHTCIITPLLLHYVSSHPSHLHTCTPSYCTHLHTCIIIFLTPTHWYHHTLRPKDMYTHVQSPLTPTHMCHHTPPMYTLISSHPSHLHHLVRQVFLVAQRESQLMAVYRYKELINRFKQLTS